MAKVRRSASPAGKAGKRPRSVAVEVELPTEYEEPVDDLNAYSFLLHGEKKIGKTTLANQGGRVLFLQCDPPQKAYRRMEIHCPNWRTFKAALHKLKAAADRKGKFPYDRVVVDGADTWYNQCLNYACEKLAIDHPEDEAYGKGWNAVRREFQDAVDALLALPCGIWFIAHSSWKEVKLRDRSKAERLLPKLSGQAEEILNGKVDGWFAYDYDEKGNRVLVIQGDEITGAGHRLDEQGSERFRTPEGVAVREIAMGNSPQEAYENFVAAFNNEYEPVRKEVSKPKKQVVKKVRRSR